MEKHTFNELRASAKKLPPPLQDALYSVEVADKIYETGKSAKLTIEKIGSLADETGNVILGFTRPSDFIKNLSESLGIDADQARDIAEKINHAIFLPLREALKITHQFDISAETVTGLEAGSTNHESRMATKSITAAPPLTPKPPAAPVVTTPTTIKSPPGIPPMPTIKPPTPPVAALKPTIPPPPTAVKPIIPPGEELKNEVEKVLKTPVPPAGAMPSWINRTQEAGSMKQESKTELNMPPSQPIDLRSQYRPTMPPSSPKVPPINLREARSMNQESRILPTTPKPAPEARSVNQEAENNTNSISAPMPPKRPEQPEPPKEKKAPLSGTDRYREPIE